VLASFSYFLLWLSLLFGSAFTPSIPHWDQSLSMIENTARFLNSQPPGSIEGHFIVEDLLEQNISKNHILQSCGQDSCVSSIFVKHGSEVPPLLSTSCRSSAISGVTQARAGESTQFRANTPLRSI
jgi:hypothetical protein